MLTLVLADAELELVPDAIRDHPQVRKAAKGRNTRASRALLDASIHHEALRDFPEGERRGRPDLVHFALLLALDSALNQQDGLRVVVHTRNDERIAVNPATRLMRHYPRFVGLVERLLRDGQAPPHGEPLLVFEPGWPLARVLEHHRRGPVVAFSEHGAPVEPGAHLERLAKGGDATVVLGCFPHGDFRVPPDQWADEVVGLGGDALSVWTVEMEVLAHWERAKGVFPRGAPAP